MAAVPRLEAGSDQVIDCCAPPIDCRRLRAQPKPGTIADSVGASFAKLALGTEWQVVSTGDQRRWQARVMQCMVTTALRG
jgi:hypothetical protein